MNLHPITAESFAIIDHEIGTHSLSPQEYAIVRRAIHSTADFDFKDLFYFSPGAIASGIKAIGQKVPIIVDVRMVAVAIASTLKQANLPQPYCALDYPGKGKTLTASGMLTLAHKYPQGLFIIGNAPTALLALVEEIQRGKVNPALVIGVPVGFVAVEEAKQALAATDVPKILVKGRKGGSAIAAATFNAIVNL